MPADCFATAEGRRLAEAHARGANWQRWGPYLSERQWGTVREDYSADGDAWDYFTHDDARSRAYRWGEDGLLGICDRECRLCFAVALWNGRDPILKERLFGLSGPQGNHGEDVKECYFYLDSTPTHSYMKALYKYPQAEFPYDRLVDENRRRTRLDPEFELIDTGIFDGGRYFDVTAEYAKAAPDDILIRLTVGNRGPEPARLHLLPTLWFRNTWSWGGTHEVGDGKPSLERARDGGVLATHATLGRFRLVAAPGPSGAEPPWLFTENETNAERLFGSPDPASCVKDAFHAYVIGGRADAVNAQGAGTKAAAHYVLDLKESLAHFRVRRRDDVARCRRQAGRRTVRGPRPGVAEPERRQDVNGRRVRSAVLDRDLDEDVFGRGLGVFDEHVEVAVLIEHARIEQLVLELRAPALLVRLDDVLVRVGCLRILVQVLHVRVRGRGVDVEVVLLHVLAVVAFAVRQSKQSLLQDRVALVPQREREAEELLVVRYAREAVFAPAIRSRARLIVAERVPCVARRAGILADGAPLPFAEIGAPLLPGELLFPSLLEAGMFGVHGAVSNRCGVSYR